MESDEDMVIPGTSAQLKKKKLKVKDIQMSAKVHVSGSLPCSPPVTGKPDLYNVRRAKAPGHQGSQ